MPMQRPRYSGVSLLVPLIVVVALSCSDGPSGPSSPVPSTIGLSITTIGFSFIGETSRVTATVKDQAGATMQTAVSWSTDNAAVATVSSGGVISAVGNGTTTVRATAGAVNAGVLVTVTQAASSIDVDPTALALASVGATGKVTAIVRDAAGHPIPGAPVAWVSANEMIATVAHDGTVTATGEGATTISAVLETLETVVPVTVGSVVALVEIVSPAAELNEGMILQLAVRVLDTEGKPVANRPVTWVSDSTAYATVDGTGRVQGVRAGFTRIRARIDEVEDTLDLPIRGLIHRWTFSEEGWSGTVFRDDVRGAEARLVEVHVTDAIASGGLVWLSGGNHLEADYVELPAGLLSTRTDATIEIWATMLDIRQWSRVFDVGDGPLNNLFVAWSNGSDPARDRTGFSVGGVEHRVDDILAPIAPNQPHHIVVSIDGNVGTDGHTLLKVYRNGELRGTLETTHRLADLIDDHFWLGRSQYAADETAHAAYEEVRIHDRVYDAEEIRQFFDNGPLDTNQSPSLEIWSSAGELIRGVGVEFGLVVRVYDPARGSLPLRAVPVQSLDPDIAEVVSGAVTRTASAGLATFTAAVAGRSVALDIEVVRIRRLPVDPYLATPLPGALWEVPVILIEYHPTADGSNLDTRKVPDFYSLNPMSLDSLEALTLRFARRRKMMVEQGSRFHGYRDASALPSLGYRVIEHIIVYDQIPPHPTKRSQHLGGARYEDWHAVFADLELEPVMRSQRIRELWVAWAAFDTGFPSYDPAYHDPDDMRVGWESNMSSPLTGDVSNSDRDPTDAPILDHTYIIYGINYRRTQAEAVHNVGHQLESMLNYVNIRQDGNTRIFWRDFVGFDEFGQFTTGRAGWTHMPPNTTGNYDYYNPTLVESDIEDWRPDNSGNKRQVNVDTWATLTYPWPGEAEFAQRGESQWYTYWFQNFPGRGNRVPHGTKWMTNWWAFVADWDAAIATGLGLYGDAWAAQTGPGTSYRFGAPSVTTGPITHDRR